GLNGGTSETEVARDIATRDDLRAGRSGDLHAVTIVTNAVNIANELVVRPHIKVVVTGGVARPQSYELTGPLGIGVLDGIGLDIAFLGVAAIDPAWGASAHHEGEANINRLMAERSKRVVVIADSSKVGGPAFARILRTEEIETLITDTGIDKEIRVAFTE